MRHKLRWALLLMLLAAALFSVSEAARSLRQDLPPMPGEIYRRYTAQADAAQYVLRGKEGYVAVCEGKGSRAPFRLTDIELATLRQADQAMLAAGIPVRDLRALLELLEDLGS